jgi:chromosome segregation ATPase
VEVRAAADYGAAPGFAGAIPYSLHVWSRRKALVTEIGEARNHRKSAESDVEKSLAALGRAVVEKAADLGGAVEALTEDLEGARAAVELVGSRQEAAVREEAENEERRRQLTADLESVKRELAPVQDRETKLQTQLGVKEQELARARAKRQRAQIEARNAEQNTTIAPEKHALASADLERYQKEQEVAEHAVRDLAEKLAEIKRDLASRLGQLAEIDKTLASLDKEKNATKRIQLASESDASKQAERALALLARRAIAAGVASSAAPELVQRVSRADEVLGRRRRRERLLRAGLDSYHKPTVYQGLGILGAAGIVVLLFVLFVLIRALF